MKVMVSMLCALTVSACTRVPATAEGRYCDAIRRAAAQADRILDAAPQFPRDAFAMLEFLGNRMETSEAELQGTPNLPAPAGEWVASEYVDQALIGLSRIREEYNEVARAELANVVAGNLHQMRASLLDRLEYCQGSKVT